MTERTLLVTSIAPHNILNQQLAVESWLRLGFSVASLNAPSEIEQLGPDFSTVEFVAVHKDASQDCGKPLVYLDDVVAFLRSHGTPVCGLINSDIHLRATPAMIDYLIGEARGSMVLSNRTDVDTLDQDAGEIYKFGFDAFFFDKSILDMLTSTDFCLGQPWWDYWLASRFMKSPQGVSCRFALKLANFPFAVHVKHDKKWDHSGNYERYGLKFAKYLDPSTHAALQVQAAETLRNSLHSLSVNVAATVLLQAQWLSYIPR
ncbi:MAG: hypothetical protein HY941_05855 [Gammaproteobacteria bacterium]|nr:hypothetical protein [Gammaproteobacteria bacterium]